MNILTPPWKLTRHSQVTEINSHWSFKDCVGAKIVSETAIAWMCAAEELDHHIFAISFVLLKPLFVRNLVHSSVLCNAVKHTVHVL